MTSPLNSTLVCPHLLGSVWVCSALCPAGVWGGGDPPAVPSPGVGQNIITSILGLCKGPTLYSFVFYLFHVELSKMVARGPGQRCQDQHGKPFRRGPTLHPPVSHLSPCLSPGTGTPHWPLFSLDHHPGPLFLFGTCPILLQPLVTLLTPLSTVTWPCSPGPTRSLVGVPKLSHSPSGGGPISKELCWRAA